MAQKCRILVGDDDTAHRTMLRTSGGRLGL